MSVGVFLLVTKSLLLYCYYLCPWMSVGVFLLVSTGYKVTVTTFVHECLLVFFCWLQSHCYYLCPWMSVGVLLLLTKSLLLHCYYLCPWMSVGVFLLVIIKSMLLHMTVIALVHGCLFESLCWIACENRRNFPDFSGKSVCFRRLSVGLQVNATSICRVK